MTGEQLIEYLQEETDGRVTPVYQEYMTALNLDIDDAYAQYEVYTCDDTALKVLYDHDMEGPTPRYDYPGKRAYTLLGIDCERTDRRITQVYLAVVSAENDQVARIALGGATNVLLSAEYEENDSDTV